MSETQNNNCPNSVLALTVGGVLSMLISGALVIATARAGISPGVSPLVVLVGWVLFGEIARNRLKPFLALLQVTGSGGAAVSAGLIFTSPILQIAAREMGQDVPAVDVTTTMLSCLAGSLMGWGFVGLASKRFLTDPRLPAPEAVACDQLIQTAAANPDDRPPIGLSLLPALAAGFFVNFLLQFKAIKDHVLTINVGSAQLPVPASPLYLGIGALLTFPTAILVFCGGLVNSVTNAIAVEQNMPDTTFRWVGGAAMAVAVLYSLLNYVLEGRKKSADAGSVQSHKVDTSLLEMTGAMRGLLISAIVVGAGLLFTILLRQDITTGQVLVLGVVSLVLISLLSGLGGLLSLQVGASASPVSGTVFMAMLILSLTAIGLSQTGFFAIATLQPVLVASCVAIAAANDSSQDYKTMQLNGYNVSSAFKGQLLGCLVGAVTVPFALWVAHDAFGLGSKDMPCPQASFFATVLQSLFDPDSPVPWGPVGAGAALGCVAVGLEMFGRSRGMILSSLAFAVGIYLPAEMGIGILLGNIARVVATGSLTRSSHRGILGAAGLITGDAMLSLLIGILAVANVDLKSRHFTEYWPTWVGLAILIGMLALLAFTYSDGRKKTS